MKIEGPHHYPNTQSVLAVHENADLLNEYFKKLMFQKWTVVRDLRGLFVQMSLFRHVLNNRYEKDIEPAIARLRSRLQVAIDKRQK